MLNIFYYFGSKWTINAKEGSGSYFFNQILPWINCSDGLWHKVTIEGKQGNLFIWRPSWILSKFFMSQIATKRLQI